MSDLLGTLAITGAGDYATVEGADLVKKLILRRLTTAPGDFFHLPEYGVGLRVKEPIPGDLVMLKARIEKQVLLEPEVAEASVALSLDATGILTVNVRGRLKNTNESFALSTSTLVSL